ncbi:hypothetical protein JCM10450v2_000082 [Rhodotorula kratochvilovae]
MALFRRASARPASSDLSSSSSALNRTTVTARQAVRSLRIRIISTLRRNRTHTLSPLAKAPTPEVKVLDGSPTARNSFDSDGTGSAHSTLTRLASSTSSVTTQYLSSGSNLQPITSRDAPSSASTNSVKTRSTSSSSSSSTTPSTARTSPPPSPTIDSKPAFPTARSPLFAVKQEALADWLMVNDQHFPTRALFFDALKHGAKLIESEEPYELRLEAARARCPDQDGHAPRRVATRFSGAMDAFLLAALAQMSAPRAVGIPALPPRPKTQSTPCPRKTHVAFAPGVRGIQGLSDMRERAGRPVVLPGREVEREPRERAEWSCGLAEDQEGRLREWTLVRHSLAYADEVELSDLAVVDPVFGYVLVPTRTFGHMDINTIRRIARRTFRTSCTRECGIKPYWAGGCRVCGKRSMWDF